VRTRGTALLHWVKGVHERTGTCRGVHRGARGAPIGDAAGRCATDLDHGEVLRAGLLVDVGSTICEVAGEKTVRAACSDTKSWGSPAVGDPG